MGLDCSHDAFHGAYSAFNRFRQAICAAMDGSHPPHDENHEDLSAERWYWGPGYDPDTHPGLYVLLCHSDCDGSISPAHCILIADELEALLPAIAKTDGYGGGHIEAAGGIIAVTQKFIDGCRWAVREWEDLEFA